MCEDAKESVNGNLHCAIGQQCHEGATDARRLADALGYIGIKSPCTASMTAHGRETDRENQIEQAGKNKGAGNPCTIAESKGWRGGTYNCGQRRRSGNNEEYNVSYTHGISGQTSFGRRLIVMARHVNPSRFFYLFDG
jgi:hypothetical protein